MGSRYTNFESDAKNQMSRNVQKMVKKRVFQGLGSGGRKVVKTRKSRFFDHFLKNIGRKTCFFDEKRVLEGHKTGNRSKNRLLVDFRTLGPGFDRINCF